MEYRRHGSNSSYGALIRMLLMVAAGSATSCNWSPQSFSKETPLMKAAQRGDAESVRKFLEDGESPNQQWDEPWRVHGTPHRRKTVLMFAAQTGGPGSRTHHEVVQLLIDAGADIYVRDTEQHTAFLYALEAGDLEVMKILWERSDKRGFAADSAILISTAYWRSPLSTESDELWKILEFLLDNVVRAEDAGEQLSLLCSSPQQRPLLMRLLDRGVRPTARALVVAAVNGQVELIPVLLAHGVNVNSFASKLLPSNVAETPLLAAVREARADSVAALLAAGADPNLSDATGQSPLIRAVSARYCTSRPNDYCEGQLAVIDLLLQHGAREDIRDVSGKRAVDYVIETGPDSTYKKDLLEKLQGKSDAVRASTSWHRALSLRTQAAHPIRLHDRLVLGQHVGHFPFG